MSQENSQSNSIVPKGCGCLSLSLFILIFFGIILEIVLPSFSSMAIKAKQTEGRLYVGSMNKGQQAHFAEKSAFATSIAALGMGIKTETTNYKYSLRATQTASFHYAVSKQRWLKNYIGGVFLVPAGRDELTTVTILCETENRPLFRYKPADEPAEPIYQNGKVICGKDTTELTKYSNYS